MTTISFINQKGGCGKSSTCFHLAGALGAMGYSILLIDADPQASLSQGFFGSVAVEDLPLHATLANTFESDRYADGLELIQPTGISNISIIPSSSHLARFNHPSPEGTGMQQYLLRELLEPIQEFDFTLIDCPPNLYMCSWTAMIASDFVIVPVPPEDFGTQGLRIVHQAIINVRELNPAIRRMGHLITRCDRRLTVHQTYEERLRRVYREQVMDTVVPEASAFKVALSCRQPVEQHDPNSKAAMRTRELAQEVLDRVAHRRERERRAA